METDTDPGLARLTARWMVSTAGSSRRIDVGHVVGELVMTCSLSARSHQALPRIPWWPGKHPVSTPVWLASVTVGSEATAPCSNAVPAARSRATLGASPRAAMSYRTLGLAPSN